MKLLVVNFHYFREQKYMAGIYPTTKDALHRQISAIAENYYFVSQEDIINYLHGQRKDLEARACCLITWDDGLVEQMAAFEFLLEMKVPAIFYVPTKTIVDGVVLDVHKLHHIRTEWNDSELSHRLNQAFPMNSYAFDYEQLKNQYRYDSPEGQRVKYFINFVLDPEEKEQAINSWFEELAGSESKFSKCLYMSAEDLKLLAAHQALGGHGHSHVPMAVQKEETAKKEIELNLSILQEISGKPIKSFSYPYGGQSAVHTDLAKHFASTEVEFALTMWRGINETTDFKAPLFLKRVDTNDAPGGKNHTYG